MDLVLCGDGPYLDGRARFPAITSTAMQQVVGFHFLRRAPLRALAMSCARSTGWSVATNQNYMDSVDREGDRMSSPFALPSPLIVALAAFRLFRGITAPRTSSSECGLRRSISSLMCTMLFCCPTKTSGAGWTAGPPAGKRVVAVKQFSQIYRMGVLRLVVLLVNATPVLPYYLRPTICVRSASVADEDSSNDSDPYFQLVHDGSVIYTTPVVSDSNTPSWFSACHTFDSESGKQ